MLLRLQASFSCSSLRLLKPTALLATPVWSCPNLVVHKSEGWLGRTPVILWQKRQACYAAMANNTKPLRSASTLEIPSFEESTTASKRMKMI
ncbi:hypothetical protein CLAIMM_12496 [Cladophialophora immunda]|nr:hypothetical protein CLAIMM_12496 [Cladophialophora immunda]